jgi:hypothetical protein
MILLLTDETWDRVRAALPAELFAEIFMAEHELPSDRDLIRMARRGDEIPAEILRVRAMREAGIEAADQTRAVFNDLIQHVHGAGVPVATMARWFGVNRRRIYETLESELTESAVT